MGTGPGFSPLELLKDWERYPNFSITLLFRQNNIISIYQGTTYPALNALLSQWVPINERAKIGTLVYAGGQIGTIIGNSVTGDLIGRTGSWESVFYLFGGLGVLWFITWTLLCYSRPEDHPFISDEEKNYLEKEIGNLLSTLEKKCVI